MKQSKIDILVATCNGEQFIQDQLDSILTQSYPHIHIFISDDASNDQTPFILEQLKHRFPKQITLMLNKERVGVKANFSRLMNTSAAPYIMFADQDDIWMPKKVEKTLQQMLTLEKLYGNHPFLVHTDLVVVDEKMKMIKDSFWKYIHIKPSSGETLNRLLSQNVVTGCTMMVNRLMVELAKPIPEDAFMHDWWMALIAATFGKIAHLNEPTLYYRQHASNALGAQKFVSFKQLRRGFQKLLNNDVRKFQQASVFFHRYHDLFDLDQKNKIKAFLNLQRSSWIHKRYEILKHQFFKHGLLRNIADFVFG